MLFLKFLSNNVLIPPPLALQLTVSQMELCALSPVEEDLHWPYVSRKSTEHFSAEILQARGMVSLRLFPDLKHYKNIRLEIVMATHVFFSL